MPAGRSAGRQSGRPDAAGPDAGRTQAGPDAGRRPAGWHGARCGTAGRPGTLAAKQSGRQETASANAPAARHDAR